jgi:hypothetical protein
VLGNVHSRMVASPQHCVGYSGAGLAHFAFFPSFSHLSRRVSLNPTPPAAPLTLAADAADGSVVTYVRQAW